MNKDQRDVALTNVGEINEPVTWATEDLQNVMSPKFKEMRMDTNSSTYKQFPIPLYTHPMRELSDEEYERLIMQWDEWRQVHDEKDTLRMFVDLILKKASEK